MNFLSWATEQVNVPGLALLVIFIFFYWQLKKEEKVQGATFRVAQFVQGTDGKGDKYGLGYVVMLIVSSWLTWYLAINDNITEWYMTAVLYALRSRRGMENRSGTDAAGKGRS